MQLRVTIVADNDSQEIHDVETGRFVEWDALVGATIERVERGDDNKLVLVLEVEDE